MEPLSHRWPAAAAILVLIIIAVGGWYANREDQDDTLPATASGELASYEFTIEVSSLDSPEDPQGIIRGWFEGPYKTRWELGPFDAEEGESTIIVVTENDFWSYDADSGTYTHQATRPTETPKGRPFPLVTNLLIGSILPESFVSNDALAQLPHEEMLGREVVVLGERTAGRAPRDLERFTTVWVDLEFRLVLREVTDTAGGSYDARIVELSLNQDVADDIFAFKPPGGAVEAPTRQPTSPRTLPTPPPSKFLRPAYVPDGMGITSSRSSYSVQGVEVSESVYESARNTMTLKQEIGNPSDLLLLGTPVAIGPYPATHSVRGDEIVVSWKQNDIKLTLRSVTLPLDELLRVARSMQSNSQPQ